MDIARIKTKTYFLYLVDRNGIDKEGYKPMIIQNPYAEILKNEVVWETTVEKIKVNLKSKSA